MHFRILGIETNSAQSNMAIDHAIFEAVSKGISPPTIRFYRWENGGISIGKGQHSNIVNNDACIKDKVGFVRRPTGGNALFHGPNDFTYAVIAPNKLFVKEGEEIGFVNGAAYREICLWIIAALEKVGIKAYLHGSNNILFDGKKISGNAQYKGKEAFLQHGSVFFSSTAEEWQKYLMIPPQRLKDIINMQQIKKVKSSIFYQALLDSFTSNQIVNGDFEAGKLSNEELRRAHELADTEFGHEKFFGTGKEKTGDVCAVDF